MKKIRPIRTYEDDQGYPTTDEHEDSPDTDRRSFLKTVLTGGAALGGSLLFADDASAGPGRLGGEMPAPKPPRPRRKPPVPGGIRPPQPPPVPRPGPTPKPPRPPKPCDTRPPIRVGLKTVFSFCGGQTGRVDVTTRDPRLAANLRQPGEGARLAPLIRQVFSRESNCGWLKDPARLAAVRRAIGRALEAYYEHLLGVDPRPLTVGLNVVPPAAPGRRRRRVYTTAGVPVRPRHRGCASCSTSSTAGDVLVPAALVLLGLYGLRRE